MTHDPDSNAHTNRRTVESQTAIPLLSLVAQAICHVGECELDENEVFQNSGSGYKPSHTC